MKKRSIFCMLCATFGINAWAATADDFLMAAEGICIRNIKNIKNVESYIKLAQGKPVPNQLNTLLSPQEGNLIGSWYLKIDDLTLIVGTSERIEAKKKTNACSIMAREIDDVGGISKKIEKLFSAKKVADDTYGYQRNETFVSNFSGDRILLDLRTSTHASYENYVVLGVVALDIETALSPLE